MILFDMGDTLCSVNDVPWKDPRGSFQLLWGQFTWKDPLKCQFTVFEGSFQVKCAHRSWGLSKGSFPGTSLTEHTVHHLELILQVG